MDFLEIGKKIAGLGLPLLANALIPGSGAVASMVASSLGLADDKPDTIAMALQTDPNAAIKLKELETRHAERLSEIALHGRQAELASETAQQQQINQTMRAEQVSDSVYKSGWRPLFGYMSALGFGGLLLALIVALFKNPQEADEIISSATIILTMMLTVLGVNIKKRSDDKQAPIAGRPIGLLEAVAKRIGGG